MANTGRTVATLLIGAAVGAAVGYIVATDDKKRKEDLDKIKNQFKDWADKAKDKAQQYRKKSEQTADNLEQDIYNA